MTISTKSAAAALDVAGETIQNWARALGAKPSVVGGGRGKPSVYLTAYFFSKVKTPGNRLALLAASASTPVDLIRLPFETVVNVARGMEQDLSPESRLRLRECVTLFAQGLAASPVGAGLVADLPALLTLLQLESGVTRYVVAGDDRALPADWRTFAPAFALSILPARESIE